jgi:hypothetical protein
MKQTLQANNLNRRRDYGYGEVRRSFSSEEESRVLNSEGSGRLRVFEELQLAVVLENQ